MYADQKNDNHVVELFESLFTCKQGDLSLHNHFGRLQALIHEINIYQPPTTDLQTLERYRQEFVAGVYLSGLHPSISAQIRGFVLSRDHVPDLLTIFSAALRVSTGIPSYSRTSLSPGDTPSAIGVPRAQDDNQPPRFDNGCLPRGKGRNSFPPCPYCGKQNHPSTKCWKQFGWTVSAQQAITNAPPSSHQPVLRLQHYK